MLNFDAEKMQTRQITIAGPVPWRVPPYTGGLNLPPRTAMGQRFPWAPFFNDFFVSIYWYVFNRFLVHFWITFWMFFHYLFDVFFGVSFLVVLLAMYVQLF